MRVNLRFWIASVCWITTFIFPSFAQNQGNWMGLGPYTAEPLPSQRHENAFVKADGKMILLGGRGRLQTDAYNPQTNTWQVGAKPPIQLHHMQPVEYEGKIYVIGAMTGGFPNEPGIPNIYIYDPAQDSWTVGPEIPADRVRGSAGVVVYQEKMYVVCGVTNGHQSGHVAWFDEYDPKNNTWKKLPDAPRARDHFQATLYQDKLIVAGGRRSKHNNGGLNSDMVREVDVYDFSTGTWSTIDKLLPTKRAGTISVLLGHELLVIGGESGTQSDAHDEVEALDLENNTWRDYPPLVRERHATQGILYQGKIYLAGGSEERGNLEIPPSDPYFMEVYTPDNLEGNQAPQARFSASTIQGVAPLTVELDASASSDDGSISSFEWVFSDGATASGMTTSYTFTNPGTFVVALTITDNQGIQAQTTTEIMVSSPAGGSGLISLEAECAELGANWEKMPHAQASNGEYVEVLGLNRLKTTKLTEADLIRFSFSVEESGAYTLWGRVLAASGGDDSFWYRLDEGPWAQWNKLSIGNSFTWNPIPSGTLALTAGAHTLTIGLREDATQLDKIIFSKSAQSPVGLGEAATNCGATPPPPPTENRPPVINFSQNIVDLRLSVNATLSSDPDGEIVSYKWNFGDGSLGIGVQTAHSYSQAGIYQVSLTAIDDAGDSTSLSKSITVSESDPVDPPSPVATTFYLEAECAQAGETWSVIEDASASNSQYLSTSGFNRFKPDKFTDADLITVQFQITEAGTYKLWGRINAASGNDDSFWMRMDGAPWSQWNKLATGKGFLWDLAPTNDFALAAGTHTLEIALREDGTQLDKLFLSKDGTSPEGLGAAAINCGAELTPPENQAPIAEFRVETNALAIQVDATNSSDSDGSIVSYAWDFGDGTQSTGVQSSHTYATEGTYTLMLTVTDDDDAETQLSQSISVVSGTDSDPDPDPAPASEAFYLEAECANLGETWQKQDDVGASQGSYVVVVGSNRFKTEKLLDADLISFEFNIADAGTYEIWGRLRAPSGSDDSFWLQVDEGTWSQWNKFTVGSNWIWNQPPQASYTLAAGTHRIVVGLREDGTELDKLYLTKLGDAPQGLGEEAINCVQARKKPQPLFVSEGVKVYPNPWHLQENLTLEVEQKEEGTLKIALWDALGRQVYQVSKVLKGGHQELRLNPGTLSPGLYVLMLEGEGYLHRTKILVQP